jgi:hypothetical protein
MNDVTAVSHTIAGLVLMKPQWLRSFTRLIFAKKKKKVGRLESLVCARILISGGFAATFAQIRSMESLQRHHGESLQSYGP